MVLLHGFIKKTQKTPQHEIDLALKRKRGGDALKKNIGYASIVGSARRALAKKSQRAP